MMRKYNVFTVSLRLEEARHVHLELGDHLNMQAHLKRHLPLVLAQAISLEVLWLAKEDRAHQASRPPHHNKSSKDLHSIRCLNLHPAYKHHHHLLNKDHSRAEAIQDRPPMDTVLSLLSLPHLQVQAKVHV